MQKTQPSKPLKTGSRRVASHRAKIRKRGFSRLEVTVPRHDVAFMRRAAETLRAGGDMAEELRRSVSVMVGVPLVKTGKDLLALLKPLAECDLDLTRDKSIMPPPRF